MEAALAHLVGNPVEAAYARSDLFERRRRRMDDWAEYLARQEAVMRPVGETALLLGTRHHELIRSGEAGL